MAKDDEAIYEAVAREIASGLIRRGLYAKAFAESGGEADATRARYVKLRAAQLQAELEQLEQSARRKTAERPQSTQPDKKPEDLLTPETRRVLGWLFLAASVLILIIALIKHA